MIETRFGYYFGMVLCRLADSMFMLSDSCSLSTGLGFRLACFSCLPSASVSSVFLVLSI